MKKYLNLTQLPRNQLRMNRKKFLMKRFFSLCFLAVLLLSTGLTAYAAEQPQVLSQTTTVLENGITFTDTITVYSQTRSKDTKGNKTRTFKDGDTVIAIITIEGTFRYDGSTVSVLSKAVTQADTYDGWNYKEKSFTSSGGTITLEGKLTKWLVFNNSFTMTLSCDKNGNLS